MDASPGSAIARVAPQSASYALRSAPAVAAPEAGGFSGLALAALGWALIALHDFAYQYVTTLVGHATWHAYRDCVSWGEG